MFGKETEANLCWVNMSIVNTTPTVRLHHNDSYNMERERGDFGVRGSHGWWCRGRWWQMDIHPPCLCPLEELPRGKMHWRREAEAKPLWRGSCQALPVMRGNAYKCASWPPPSDSPSHTCTHTHTHQTQAGNRTFFLLSPFYSFCLAVVESDSQSLNNSSNSPHRYVRNGTFKSMYLAVCLSCMTRMCSHDKGFTLLRSTGSGFEETKSRSLRTMVVVSCSSHHIEEVLQLAFSAISTLARWRLMSFTDNTEWDCGGR